MKRLLFFSLLLACFATVYGQAGKNKQATRIPVDSVVRHSYGKGSAQVIDGSQNVQTRSGGQSTNPFAMNGGQQRQLPARINAAHNLAGNAHLTSSNKRGEPQSVFIERKRDQVQLRSAIVRSPQETAYAFFKETPQLNIPKPELQIRIDSIETDNLNMTHVKGMQLYRNIPVWGMYFTFHISSENERFLGYTVDTTLIQPKEVRFKAADAVSIAERDLSQTTAIQPLAEFMKKTLNYEHPAVEEIYYPTQSDVYTLCYKVLIRPNVRDRWIYYVDANSGEVVDKFNNTPSDGPNTGSGKDLNGVTRTVNTYLDKGTHYMVNTTKPMYKAADFSGIIGVFDAKNEMKFHETGSANLATNNSATWSSPQAISAMYHCTLVYDYLQNTLKRNSFDGKGTSMQAIINVCDPNNGGGYDNAFWNGAIVALGNGAVNCKPLAGA